MTRNSRVILGILGALTAGLAIGLLVAPEKGKDMRLKIKKSSDKLADNLSHLLASAKEKLSRSDAKQKSEQLKESLG